MVSLENPADTWYMLNDLWTSEKMPKKRTFTHLYIYIWHSLKSGPETRDLAHWDLGPWDTETLGHRDPRTWDPRTLELGPGELALATVGHGTLTPETLEMGPWDLEISNWPPPDIHVLVGTDKKWNSPLDPKHIVP